MTNINYYNLENFLPFLIIDDGVSIEILKKQIGDEAAYKIQHFIRSQNKYNMLEQNESYLLTLNNLNCS